VHPAGSLVGRYTAATLSRRRVSGRRRAGGCGGPWSMGRSGGGGREREIFCLVPWLWGQLAHFSRCHEDA
jgi:hypothetical protein